MSTALDVPMAGDWVVALGEKHGARERAAVLAAGAAADRAAETAKLSLERWTHIVSAMTHMVAAYNAGFDRDVLSLVEDRSDPDRLVTTILADSDGSPSLEAALEGTLICVRGRDAQGMASDAECPLLPDRDDGQTAAYVLRHWMERL
jgi:hypothetical protein